MSKIFAQNIDLNKNEALNFRLENQITFPSVTAPDSGFVFFHSANDKFYGWTGTTWLDFSLGGGGGGGDVFLAANQTFTGSNTFSGGLITDDTLAFIKRAGNIVSSSQGLTYFKTDNTFNISVGTGTAAHNVSFAGIDSFTATRTFTFPDTSGTFALEGSFVELTGNQTIAGDKTFSGELNANTIVFTDVTSLPLQEGIGTLSSRLIFRDEATNQPFQFNGDNLTSIHTYTLPNATGTLALEGSFVDLTSNQSIAGSKEFTGFLSISGNILGFPSTVTKAGTGTGGAFGYIAFDKYFFAKQGEGRGAILDLSLISAGAIDRTYSLPNKNGTFALLDDVSSVTQTTNTLTLSLDSSNGNWNFPLTILENQTVEVGDIVFVNIVVLVAAKVGAGVDNDLVLTGLTPNADGQPVLNCVMINGGLTRLCQDCRINTNTIRFMNAGSSNALTSSLAPTQIAISGTYKKA